jgi:transcriptional regulator with XRE-family HTH domain
VRRNNDVKVRELGRYIRDQRSSLSLSLRSFSGLTGVSIPYLSQIERGLRRPSADILNAIAKALRISSETLYIKAGILDERDTVTDPVGEILRDANINERQKRILVELYQSFREEATASHAPAATKRAVAAQRKAAPKKRATATRRPAAKRATRTTRARKATGKARTASKPRKSAKARKK